jgi:hypothetical protein
MRPTTHPRVSRIIAWLRNTWAELDYAQRRMIELNMATPPPGRHLPARASTSWRLCTHCRRGSRTTEFKELTTPRARYPGMPQAQSSNRRNRQRSDPRGCHAGVTGGY